MSALGTLIGGGVIAALALAALSLWKGLNKGRRIELERLARREKDAAEIARRRAEVEREAAEKREEKQRRKAKAAADRVIQKAKDNEKERQEVRDLPDDSIGDALDDELGR